MTKRTGILGLIAFIAVFFYSCESEDNTTEGSWEAVESPTSSWLMDVHFTDDVNGWAVGWNGTLLQTDNGENWQSFSITGITDDRLYGVAFSDNQHGVIVGYSTTNQAIAYATRNGGTSWTEVTLPFKNFTPRAVAFAENGKGWITGSEGTILYTEDKGQSWQLRDSETATSLYGIATVEENKVFVCGSSTLLYSADAGSSWQQLIDEQDGYGWLQDVYFTDDNSGWIATGGGTGSIYYTPDGGQTWEKQLETDTEYLKSVFFSSPEKGWTVGEAGNIYRTKDGEQWFKIENPVNYDLSDVHFTNASNGWAVGYNGTLLLFN